MVVILLVLDDERKRGPWAALDEYKIFCYLLV